MITKSRLLLVLGFILLGLGTIGIFLPILPTTPFVLAAAGCFSGNKRMSAWLHKSRFFSDYITSYKKHKGLQKSTVIKSLVFLWTMMGISVICMKTLWASICLPVIGIAVTVHILYMARPKNASHRSEDRCLDDNSPGEIK
ncbi:YbaN family protein [Anaerocolumna xylanovorans]|uniref:Inner membrane protein n=1 Tax=Anaerocolumna xylanovorans DSM 12503 TaxID=1121345 RepID=A0A1M7XZU4_9FIRM|nr:YbaN family protein [Anaerocolumna xylanovorans]SHO44717.1 hypothetical protein SAMN02745217_00698 [Anaerocolumna xylanovorans DSM 12503]